MKKLISISAISIAFLLVTNSCSLLGVKSVDDAVSCESLVSNLLTANKNFAAHPNKSNCLAVESALKALVESTCTTISATERQKYETMKNNWDCSSFH